MNSQVSSVSGASYGSSVINYPRLKIMRGLQKPGIYSIFVLSAISNFQVVSFMSKLLMVLNKLF